MTTSPLSMAPTSTVVPPLQDEPISGLPGRRRVAAQDTSSAGPKAADNPGEAKEDPFIDLATFRILLGIRPIDDTLGPSAGKDGQSSILPPPATATDLSEKQSKKQSSLSPASNTAIARPGRFEWMWAGWKKKKDNNYDSSVYIAICNEENKAGTYYHLYDFLAYTSLIVQLIISAVLVLLGALNGNHHITVAVLGSVNGVITGILSLIRGQGLPKRFMNYRYSLRRVREEIEFVDRELLSNVIKIKYSDAKKLVDAYQQCQTDNLNNHPDTWTSGLPVTPSMSAKADSSGGTRLPAQAAQKPPIGQPP